MLRKLLHRLLPAFLCISLALCGCSFRENVRHENDDFLEAFDYDNDLQEYSTTEYEAETETETEAETEAETETETEEIETTTEIASESETDTCPKTEDARDSEVPTGAVPYTDYPADKDYKGSGIKVPKVYITTNNNYGRTLIQDSGYVGASIMIVSTDGTVINEDNTAQIRVRGNSTSNGIKKPYNIKLSKKQDVLGMGESKRWTLLADWFDPTMMRNYIALYLADKMEIPNTPDMNYVQVWVDDNYEGSYLLTTTVEAAKTRVDIDTDDDEFMIMLEMNRKEEGKTYFKTNAGYTFMVKEPERPSKEQLSKIKSTVNKIENAVRKGDISKYSKLIDVDSFVKFGLFNDYIMTCDIAFSSTYFYYKDGKLYAGPVWDFDMSLGNVPENEEGDPDFETQSNISKCVFFASLYKDEDYLKRVQKEYEKNRDIFIDLGAEGGLCDRLYGKYNRMYVSNFEKTGYSILRAGWEFGHPVFLNYKQNVDYLKYWLNHRFLWFDEQMLAAGDKS